MTGARRSTLVVHGRLAMREARLRAARNRTHGLQVLSIEQAAVRLAGGFVRPLDAETLRGTIQAVLPETPMGELERIKMLPGMAAAAADTLDKAWRAGIDLQAQAGAHPRLDAMARLEQSVLGALPAGMLRPADIVAAAIARIAHAPAVLGAVELCGLTELSPCWRPLLQALAARLPVTWAAGPRSTPAWLEGMGVTVTRAPAHTPAVTAVSAATAYHEALEAMRWVRELLASGVSPRDVALASASSAEYDDHLLALRDEASIDLHFVHGVRAVTTREGQAAAALADIVVRGLSQSRLRRLAALCRDSAPFAGLPEGWVRVLPADAPLATPGAWGRLLARLTAQDWPDGRDHGATLRAAVASLSRGPGAAAETGEAFLQGRARDMWRKALAAGPAGSVDATLEVMKQDDGLEACVSVAWMPASALAASPRRFVRLLGLNAGRWPRAIAEDRLIPDHIIATAALDPLPVALADRRDFATILATTEGEVVLSRARRDSDGRLLGRSPLRAAEGAETFLRRNATPVHAFSEADRLMARPHEFAADPQAVSARTCWRAWRQPDVTPHDGLVRTDHPLILASLARTQSATSLRRLLRNPIAFVWEAAFGWREPESAAEPLVLDARQSGDLLHAVLEHAVGILEAGAGLAGADANAIAAAAGQAVRQAAEEWSSRHPVPPAVIWARTLDEAQALATRVLSQDDLLPPGARSYAEVAFGGARASAGGAAPWDPAAPVTIPGAGFAIRGVIDRLDISADGLRAQVHDYKTGLAPEKEFRIDGGRELQRGLYAFAVRALLGPDVEISASLRYLRAAVTLRIDDPDALMDDITRHLDAARRSLASGAALPGKDAGEATDGLAFALPANPGQVYAGRKQQAVRARLGEAADVWEAV
jgi:RecB family exonuclease